MRIALQLHNTFVFTYPCPRRLREIIKISLIERETSTTISQIWEEYHKPRPNNVCTVLTKQKYLFLKNQSQNSPLFMLPVRREGGHFKLLSQWQQDCYMATFLEDYKQQGTKAQPYVVYTLFTELLFLKGIVLVRGDIINYSITKVQAEDVLKNLIAVYTQQNELVKQFNHSPNNFEELKYNQYFSL